MQLREKYHRDTHCHSELILNLVINGRLGAIGVVCLQKYMDSCQDYVKQVNTQCHLYPQCGMNLSIFPVGRWSGTAWDREPVPSWLQVGTTNYLASLKSQQDESTCYR